MPVTTLYDVEYFTASQVGIYLGDILLDEAASILFSVNQSKSPIFGYASRYFDAVATGNTIVNGQITINFIDSGYLFAALARAKSDSPQEEGPDWSRIWNNMTNKEVQDLQSSALNLIQEGFLDNTERTRLLQLLALPEIDQKNLIKNQRGVVSVTAKATTTEKLATDLKAQWWGSPGTQFQDASLLSPDSLGGFDLKIQYGYRIVGDNQVAGSPSFTNRWIRQVHITGMQQVIDSGTNEPIAENYSFLARDAR